MSAPYGSDPLIEALGRLPAVVPDEDRAAGLRSQYRALLERQVRQGLSFSLGYTFSRTTDNTPGLRSSDPLDQLDPFPQGSPDGGDWREGRSDFDVPHRVALAAEYRPAGETPISIGARWRFRSGLPFTPGFQPRTYADAGPPWICTTRG